MRTSPRVPASPRRWLQVAILGLVIVLAGAGVGTAANIITGADVRRGTLTGKHIRNGSIGNPDIANRAIDHHKLSRGVWRRIRAIDTQGSGSAPPVPGPAGAPGPAGPRGATGPQGEPGQALVHEAITPPNPNVGGLNVLEIPVLAAGSPGPSSTEGVELVAPVRLDAGTYLAYSTAQFFDFSGQCTGAAYPVTKSFMNGQELGTGWASAVPVSNPNNAGQGASTAIVHVPAGGATLSSHTAIRVGNGTVPANCHYHGGASLIVTRLST